MRARGFQATASSNVTFDQISSCPTTRTATARARGGEFEFVDGSAHGTNDGVDESWGPKLDAGLMIPQWFSNGAPAPWVSSPNNVRDFFQTGTSISNNISATGSGERANFRLSFGNEQHARASCPTSRLDRLTAGLNGTASLSEKLQANASVQYIRNKAPQPSRHGLRRAEPDHGLHVVRSSGRHQAAPRPDEGLHAPGVQSSSNGVDFTDR